MRRGGSPRRDARGLLAAPGGQLVQALAPVTQLLVQHLAPQPLPLPDGVVGVLDGEAGKPRTQVFGEGVVKLSELAHEDPQRPSVRRDVMQGHEEDVLLLALS